MNMYEIDDHIRVKVFTKEEWDYAICDELKICAIRYTTDFVFVRYPKKGNDIINLGGCIDLHDFKPTMISMKTLEAKTTELEYKTYIASKDW